MSSTVIVVPCYNEAERLKLDDFREFARHAKGTRLLFVNDGSRDATLDKLHMLASENPRFFLIRDLAKNVGKAEAVRQGFLDAFDRRPDFVGFWDADLATPLSAIEQFQSVLERRADIQIVMGTRMRLRGRAIRRKTVRRLLGRAFAQVASHILGASIYDTQCGAKLFRVTDECQAMFHEPFLARWIFDVELLARLKGLRADSAQPWEELLYELPLDAWEDVAGSKLKPWDFVRAIGELFAIRRRYAAGVPYQLDAPAVVSFPVAARPVAQEPGQRRAA